MSTKSQRTTLALLNPVPTYILCSKNVSLQVFQPGKNKSVWFCVPRVMVWKSARVSDASYIFGGM